MSWKIKGKSVTFGYNNVVQDGLVLNLDAGVPASYSGSGTTWYDLSFNGNNGTLENGVGFDGGNGGSLVFDGVDDYIALPYQDLLDLGTQLTICGYTKIKDLNDNQRIFASYDVTTTNTYTEGFLFYYRYPASNGLSANTLAFQYGKNTWAWNVFGSNGLTITDNNFHFVAVTASNLNTTNPTIKFYIDGNNVSGTSWTASSPQPIRYASTTDSIRIASTYTATRPSYSEVYSDIDLGGLQIYNRELSESEIQQNFDAFRGRNVI